MDEETQIRQEIRTLRARKIEAEEEHKKVMDAINSARQELQDVQASINIAKRAADGEEARATEYTEKRKELELVLDVQTEKKKKGESDLSELGTKLSGLETEVSKFSEKVDSMEDDARAEVKRRIAKEEEKLATLQSTQVAVDNQIKEAKENHKKLLADQENIQASIKVDVARADEVKTAINILLTKKEELEKATKDMEVALDTSSGRNVALSKENEALATSLNDKQSELSTATDATVVAKTELAQTEKALAEVKAQYDVEKVKLFNISERESALKQREEYIIERYKEAGVEYQPI